MKIARGCYQSEIFRELVNGHTIYPPERTLRGRAAGYLSKYRASFCAVLERMAEAGYKVERIPGPKGGEWGATYRLTACPIAR